jgi:hypothetical protein
MNDISYIVQIFSRVNSVIEILGTGFIYSKQGVIVTCYHVVEDAPRDSLRIKFKFNNAEISMKAVLLDHDESEDIAILKTVHLIDFEINIPVISESSILNERDLKTFGFPDIDDFDGIFSEGEILGRVTENDKLRFQSRFEEVEEGFSGAPVWSKQTGEIIGIICIIIKPTANYRNLKTTFIIPASTFLTTINNLNNKILDLNSNPILNIAICKNSDIFFSFSESALRFLPIEVQNFRFEKATGIESYLNFMQANPIDAKLLKNKILQGNIVLKEFGYWEKITAFDIIFVLYKASLEISENNISLLKIIKKSSKKLIVLLLISTNDSPYLIQKWVERLTVEEVDIIKINDNKKDMVLYILLNEYSHLLPPSKVGNLSESLTKFNEQNY